MSITPASALSLQATSKRSLSRCRCQQVRWLCVSPALSPALCPARRVRSIVGNPGQEVPQPFPPLCRRPNERDKNQQQARGAGQEHPPPVRIRSPSVPCCRRWRGRPCAATLLHWASSLLCVCAQERAPLPRPSLRAVELGEALAPGNLVFRHPPLRKARSPCGINGLGVMGGLGPGEKVGFATQLLCCKMSIYYCLENGICCWGTPGIEFPGHCCSVRGESSLRAGVRDPLPGSSLARGCLPSRSSRVVPGPVLPLSALPATPVWGWERAQSRGGSRCKP